MSVEEPPEGFHRPQQERSRRTLARIVDAAESILLERGPGDVTVQNVVARADTSVGAFYTRFRSKDDAVAYVHRRFWDDVGGRWSRFLAPEAWTGVPVDAVIAEVVRRYVRILLSDRGRARAFLLELLGRRDEALLARLRRLDEEIAGAMGRLVEERRTELEGDFSRDAAEEGFRRVLSAARDHVLFGVPGGEASGEGEGGRPRDRRRRGGGARRLVLSLVRMYGGLLGVRHLPASYGELLATCRAASPPRQPPDAGDVSGEGLTARPGPGG